MQDSLVFAVMKNGFARATVSYLKNLDVLTPRIDGQQIYALHALGHQAESM